MFKVSKKSGFSIRGLFHILFYTFCTIFASATPFLPRFALFATFPPFLQTQTNLILVLGKVTYNWEVGVLEFGIPNHASVRCSFIFISKFKLYNYYHSSLITSLITKQHLTTEYWPPFYNSGYTCNTELSIMTARPSQ